MAKNKIVDLKEYRSQKALEKQIEELDRLGDAQYEHMTPIEQKGYRNFMKLLKAVDQKYSPTNPTDE
mgnify:CR=1 FL=1